MTEMATFTCPACHQIFMGHNAFVDHKQQCSQHICQKCNNVFQNETLLRIHMIIAHSVKEQVTHETNQLYLQTLANNKSIGKGYSKEKTNDMRKKSNDTDKAALDTNEMVDIMVMKAQRVAQPEGSHGGMRLKLRAQKVKVKRGTYKEDKNMMKVSETVTNLLVKYKNRTKLKAVRCKIVRRRNKNDKNESGMTDEGTSERGITVKKEKYLSATDAFGSEILTESCDETALMETDTVSSDGDADNNMDSDWETEAEDAYNDAINAEIVHNGPNGQNIFQGTHAGNATEIETESAVRVKKKQKKTQIKNVGRKKSTKLKVRKSVIPFSESETTNLEKESVVKKKLTRKCHVQKKIMDNAKIQSECMKEAAAKHSEEVGISKYKSTASASIKVDMMVVKTAKKKVGIVKAKDLIKLGLTVKDVKAMRGSHGVPHHMKEVITGFLTAKEKENDNLSKDELVEDISNKVGNDRQGHQQLENNDERKIEGEKNQTKTNGIQKGSVHDSVVGADQHSKKGQELRNSSDSDTGSDTDVENAEVLPLSKAIIDTKRKGRKNMSRKLGSNNEQKGKIQDMKNDRETQEKEPKHSSKERKRIAQDGTDSSAQPSSQTDSETEVEDNEDHPTNHADSETDIEDNDVQPANQTDSETDLEGNEAVPTNQSDSETEVEDNDVKLENGGESENKEQESESRIGSGGVAKQETSDCKEVEDNDTYLEDDKEQMTEAHNSTDGAKMDEGAAVQDTSQTDSQRGVKGDEEYKTKASELLGKEEMEKEAYNVEEADGKVGNEIRQEKGCESKGNILNKSRSRKKSKTIKQESDNLNNETKDQIGQQRQEITKLRKRRTQQESAKTDCLERRMAVQKEGDQQNLEQMEKTEADIDSVGSDSESGEEAIEEDSSSGMCIGFIIT